MKSVEGKYIWFLIFILTVKSLNFFKTLEHKSRVETLESRLENLTSKYQELQQQYQDAELELTAFRGSKKDKDERLSDFKREILTLQEMYKAEVKSHNSTTVELHKHQDMLKALREDHDDLHEKFLIGI